MISIETAVYQNNMVVASLRANEYNLAVEIASSALGCHRALLTANAAEDPLLRACRDDSIDQCMLLTDPCESTRQSSNKFIYDKGILLPSNVSDPTVITPILIFNSALAYQLFAQTQEENSSFRLLPKAKRMYDLAFHAAHHMDQNLLFEYSILNNVAVIDQTIGNTTVSNAYFEYLLSAMMLFVDQGFHLRLRHLEGFLLNVPQPIRVAKAA